ncbi:cation-transporting P-type ATPase [Nitrosomonas sp. wSCUT-2]
MTNWHSLSAQQVLQTLDTNEAGLSQAEAEQRIERYGVNRLRSPSSPGFFTRFLLQFHNILIYILLIASAVTALIGHWPDSCVILAVVIINAVIGVIQEGKAEKALAGIRSMLSINASVLRDNHRRQVSAEVLVPGDIVLLQSGDKVPADMRLLSCKNLRVDEAILTGESQAVEKGIEPVLESVTVGDRFCMAYSGTLVVYGQAAGVVVATGYHTEIGRISTMLEQVNKLSTPLLRKIADFGFRLAAVTFVLVLVVILYGLLAHDYGIDELFMAAVGIAVAVIPEELPPIMTITLALGVQRMARHNAIIRHLPAVETLGAVTVICTDKTGTLTRNEMTVQQIYTADERLQVSGAGYVPEGSFSSDGQKIQITDHPGCMDLLRAGLLCSDANLQLQDDQWIVDGDPTEGAVIAAAMKAALNPAHVNETLPRKDVIPFESEHRLMATLHHHHDHDSPGVIFVKGAPETILALCNQQRSQGNDRALDHPYWNKIIQKATCSGLRMLAIAQRAAEWNQQKLRFSDVRENFTLLGMVGMTDPPREEAIAAVNQCHHAGIRVKMITGDHQATASAIGVKLNLGNGHTVLTGVALDSMNDKALRQAVTNIDVFARTNPEHKLRLVAALQANGEIVAMTGDGVNDAPALKRADVGVAMGQKGTEVAKEAAEMVLADDNFVSIVHAVKEGRTAYDNIKKTMVYVLPTNGGEAGLIILAIFLGITLPITPVQILWINMVTTVTLAVALSFEPPEPDVMQRPPRHPEAPLLSGFLVWRVVFVALLMISGGLGLTMWETMQGSSIEFSRTVLVNLFVFCEILYLFNCRYLLTSVMSLEGFLGNRYVLMSAGLLVLLQLLFTYLPAFQLIFGTVALDIEAWGRIIFVGLVLFFIIELEKYLLRCRGIKAL